MKEEKVKYGGQKTVRRNGIMMKRSGDNSEK